MEKQIINVKGMNVSVPEYYQQVDSMPDDPADSKPLMVQTPYAVCFALVMPITPDQCIPFNQRVVIESVRHYLNDNQGLIEVNQGKDYIYSIVKTLKEPSGVQYVLTFQKYFDDEHILSIQGYFEESGTTGMRDSMVYEFCRKKNWVGSEEDPFAGWTRDPYDPEYKKGALMNVSEQAQFDEKFPGFPLSMCRELVHTIIG